MQYVLVLVPKLKGTNYLKECWKYQLFWPSSETNVNIEVHPESRVMLSLSLLLTSDIILQQQKTKLDFAFDSNFELDLRLRCG